MRTADILGVLDEFHARLGRSIREVQEATHTACVLAAPEELVALLRELVAAEDAVPVHLARWPGAGDRVPDEARREWTEICNRRDATRAALVRYGRIWLR